MDYGSDPVKYPYPVVKLPKYKFYSFDQAEKHEEHALTVGELEATWRGKLETALREQQVVCDTQVRVIREQHGAERAQAEAEKKGQIEKERAQAEAEK